MIELIYGGKSYFGKVVVGTNLSIAQDSNGLTTLNGASIGGSSVDWPDITSKPDTATRWPTWTEVTGKPATFAPSAHTHDAGDVFTGQFVNGRISQSSVTQHQAALSIGTGQLTGTTLPATIVHSSLTDVGTLTALAVSGSIFADGGITTTATNLFIAAPGAHSVVFSANGAERERITPAGHHAFATTDVEGWAVSYRALQLGTTAAIMYGAIGQGLWLTDNAYYDGFWKYRATASASLFEMVGSSITFYAAGSNTIDSTVDWTGILGLTPSNATWFVDQLPTATDTYNLGSNAKYWHNLYTTNASFPGGVTIGSLVVNSTAMFTGNVAIGTNTISPWASSYNALQLGSVSAIMFANATTGIYILDNAYYDGSAQPWKRRATVPASAYTQFGATHTFYVAGTGTAGSAIAWSSTLSLDITNATLSVHLMPNATATYNIGSGGAYWASLYVMNASVASSLSAANITASVSVSAGTAGVGGVGQVSMVKGTAANIGYIEWYKPNATRTAYMGYGADGLHIEMESGYFSVTGLSVFNSDIIIGSLGVFDSSDVPANNNLLVYNLSTNTWHPQEIQFTFGSSDIKNAIFTDSTTGTYILNDPGAGAAAASLPAPFVIAYGSHKSITVQIVKDSSGVDYVKPANFRYFRIDYDTSASFAGATTLYLTSDKFVHSRLVSGTTYYYRAYVYDRAGNVSSVSNTASTTPQDSVTAAFGVLLAGEIGVASLSTITATVGDMTAGQIRNQANTAGFFIDTWPGASAPDPGWARYFSLVGYGSQKFIMHENFELRHDGLARLKSRLVANTTTFWTSDAVETTLKTMAVPGGYEGNKGGLHITTYLTFNTGINGICTVRIKVAGVVVASFVATVATTGTMELWGECYMFNENSQTAARKMEKWVAGDNTTKVAQQTALAITTSADHDVTITVQNSNNSITASCQMAVVDILPKD